MRVGLFGGSFNPIHLGHLRAAEEVREAMELDLVYFIPAASPPHKSPDGLAAPDHRLRMAQLATKGNRHFMVSDAEVRRVGYIAKAGYYAHPSGQTLNFVTTTYLPISESAIREELQQEKSARYLVPVEVLDYIERHGLY